MRRKRSRERKKKRRREGEEEKYYDISGAVRYLSSLWLHDPYVGARLWKSTCLGPGKLQN